jgi:hypothetical protein
MYMVMLKHRIYLQDKIPPKAYPKSCLLQLNLAGHDSFVTGKGGNCLLIARLGTDRRGLTSFARPVMQPSDGIDSFHLDGRLLFAPLAGNGSLFDLRCPRASIGCFAWRSGIPVDECFVVFSLVLPLFRPFFLSLGLLVASVLCGVLRMASRI